MTARKWRKMTSAVVQVAMFVAIYWGVQTWQKRDAASGPAPSFNGTTLSGDPVSLASYEGRPVVVHFWATWCSICRLEQGTIEALAGDYPVLAIASQSGTQDEVRDYARQRGLRVPILVDEGGGLAARFGVRAFPTTFIVDANGKIRHITVGYTSSVGLRARLWLTGL